MSNLFISHSSRDNAAAQELQAKLQEQGHHSVFLDLDPEAGIQAGVSWERTLYTKLRACRAVVALCSDSYLASQWCFAEIALARMEGKELFVLQIDPWSDQTQMPSILTEEQFIDLRTNKDDGYQRLWNGFKVKGIVAAEHRQWTAGESPYPGLRAFEEKDAAVFFGRDDEVREGVELLNRVRRQGHPRLVMVLGSSGSGKSSLARAGIVPQLRRDEGRWLVVGPFRPGRQPARALAVALSKAFKEAGKLRPWEEILGRLDTAALESASTSAEPAGSDEVELEQHSAREMLREALLRMEGELSVDDAQVAMSIQRLKEYLERSAGAAPTVRVARTVDTSANPLAALATELCLDKELADAKVVLVIDQFEELLGHEDEGDDHPANRFLSLLKGGIEAEDNPPLALGTMRSDFLGMLQRSGPLRGVGFKSLSVGPMSEEGMLKVIEEPATLGQIDLEKPELTQRLLRETGTPDALPLLAFTLRAMWDRYHETKRFDVQGYEALGGLQGAIAQVADDTMEAALAKSDGGTEKDMRVAFLSLARPAAEGVGWARQPASWDEMPERVQPMIQQFIDQRLLVKRADGTVEVAHEALFRSWKKLRAWLDANTEGLHLLREIRVDAEKWGKAETDADKEPYLWRSGRLARALELRDRGVLKLTDLDTSFIERSDSEETRKLAAEEARRKAELEQARKLAEEQKRSARRTRIAAYGIGAGFIIAILLAIIAYQQKIAAQDQALVAIASDWLAKDPTKAALVLLEIRKPKNTPRAVPLMGEVLRRRLAQRELWGHEDEVTSASFNPQGDRILTTSRDGTARLWNSDGTSVLIADGSGTPVNHIMSAAFSRRGDRIVTASLDGTARVWDVRGEDTNPVLLRHGGKLFAAAFSPTADRIVTASEDGTAKVWEVNGALVSKEDGTGNLEFELEANSIAFDREGRRVLTADNDGLVKMWNAGGNGEQIRGEKLHCLARLRDPLASCDDKPSCANEWEPSCQGSQGEPVLRATFDSRGERVLTASQDNTARLWTASLGPVTRRAHPCASSDCLHPVVFRHEDDVYSAIFTPDDQRVLTASNDGAVRMWDLEGVPVKMPDGMPWALRHAGGVTGVSFSSDDAWILTASKDGTARVWSVEQRGEPLVLEGKEDEGTLLGVRFEPGGGRSVVTVTQIGRVVTWSADTGQPMSAPVDLTGFPTESTATHIASTATGNRIVVSYDDGTSRLWTHDGKPVAGRDGQPAVLGHKEEMLSAAFSTDGDRVVTTSYDGTARVWSAADGSPITVPDRDGRPVVLQHDGAVYSAAFSPNGNRIVTACEDGTARIWNANGISPESNLVLRHNSEVTSAAFSPGGDRIVTGSGPDAWVWKADGSSKVRLKGHEKPVHTAVFDVSGKQVVTGSEDQTARVWDATGRSEPLVLRGHQGFVVNAVQFDTQSKQNDLVVTASWESRARVWRVSYDSLGAEIRSVITEICLDPVFRRKILSEDERTAQKRYSRCGDCLEAYRARSSSTRGAAKDFQAYKDCVLPGFF